MTTDKTSWTQKAALTDRSEPLTAYDTPMGVAPSGMVKKKMKDGLEYVVSDDPMGVDN